MNLRETIKQLTPPLFFDIYKRWQARSKNSLHLAGDYASWEEAAAHSTGYDAPLILEKTKNALLKVKRGEAVYERESFLYDEIHYDWPLLAALMWVAAQDNGRLNVLDFGGSLGSVYFQNRLFLSQLNQVRWNIIEQTQHVATGKEWFEDDHLKFHLDIKTCLAETTPNVVILSGVLQTLDQPYQILNQLLSIPCNHIIIDRTPFWDGPKDRLCIQNIPPIIYTASYPCWIFSKQQFRSHIPNEWQTLVEFDSFDNFPAPVKTTWKGMLLSRQPSQPNGTIS